MPQKISRRSFLTQAAAAPAILYFGSSRVFGWPSEKLNIGCIGVRGRGEEDVKGVSGENIVALCDVDENNLGAASKDRPNAKTYTDFRKLLEQKDIDAVTVATPDHIHAPAAVMAMKLGKHVYCEKPLTHSIYEARVMAETAAKKKVATQMGNQGHSIDNQRTVIEIMHAGVLGAVREVHCWTNRPIWPQGLDRPKETPEAPKHLHWDLWLGPAPERPFHPGTYHPFSWRGWWDFGTGALGDMACHVMDAAFWGLKLGSPTSVEAEGGPRKPECGPNWETIRYEFPARGDMAPVKLTWYDGQKDGKPNQGPADLIGEKALPECGTIFVGEKGMLYIPDAYGEKYTLYPKDKWEGFKPPDKTLPRAHGAHHHEWIKACKGEGKSLSNFDYAGPFTEMVLLGVVAFRTGQKIQWDGPNMKAKNCPEADPFIKREYRKGWSL